MTMITFFIKIIKNMYTQSSGYTKKSSQEFEKVFSGDYLGSKKQNNSNSE